MADGATRGVLRTNWFYVLVALADGARHGSAVARDVLDQTDGALRLWPATLYRTLDQMVAAGMIEELEDSEHPEGGAGRRRYYRLTRRGRLELAAAADRMAASAGRALRRLGRA